ncbi:MAG: MipA/OmpV family protein [Gammaproteobacteria bacterium]|nr:MipA/OmpV family protein [Gammaproteobacteria bacterium]
MALLIMTGPGLAVAEDSAHPGIPAMVEPAATTNADTAKRKVTRERLWEVGMGIGGLHMTDYEGSSETQSYAFPIPYLIYNGEFWKVSRQGVRRDVVRTDSFKFDVSGNVGPPVNSEDNTARVDMPDLDPTFEIGPSMELLLWNSADKRHVWSLRMPARAVFVTDFSDVEPAGWRLLPNINYDAHDLGRREPGAEGWHWGISVGPVWATEAYHDYYYEVDPIYATPTRPAYNARGGYSGIGVGFAVRKRYKNVWFGLFARYRNLAGAIFEDSPLVEQRDSLVVGGGLSFIFAQSDEYVEIDSIFD